MAEDGQRVGYIENASSQKVQRWIECGKRMKEERMDTVDLRPNEVIVAIRFGLNKYNSVLNIQFVFAEVPGIRDLAD